MSGATMIAETAAFKRHNVSPAMVNSADVMRPKNSIATRVCLYRICTYRAYRIYFSDTCPSGGDEFCDGDNNNAACNYDDGDCCLAALFCNTTRCAGIECICHETGISNCHPCSFIDNSECDGPYNHILCAYDGGDCCLATTECSFCFGEYTCACHLTGKYHCTCPFGGDLICDGANNVEMCNFDDGDCCLEIADCSYCSGDYCLCQDTGQNHCSESDDNSCPLKGNGICNSDHNNPLCLYDGGDCCLEGTHCTHCSGDECFCHETGLDQCFKYGNMDKKK